MTTPSDHEALALLRVKAVEIGETLDCVLHRYVQQRFVARVASSTLRENLCLRGALLLGVFNDLAERWHRPTQSADFLSRDPIDPGRFHSALAMSLTEALGDGVIFDASSLSMRAAPVYRGVQTALGGVTGRVGNQSATIEFRIEQCEGPLPAHNDVYVHPVIPVTAMANPRPLAITAEVAIAERLVSLFWRGTRGARFEDLVDLQLLIAATSCNTADLSEAIVEAFVRRKLSMPTSLPGPLQGSFFNHPLAQRRWAAFNARQLGSTADSQAARSQTVREDLAVVASDLAEHVWTWIYQIPQSAAVGALRSSAAP